MDVIEKVIIKSSIPHKLVPYKNNVKHKNIIPEMHSTLEDLERQIDEAKYFKPPASRLHVPSNGDKYTCTNSQT